MGGAGQDRPPLFMLADACYTTAMTKFDKLFTRKAAIRSYATSDGDASGPSVAPAARRSGVPLFRALKTGGGGMIRVMREDAFQRAVAAANKKIA